MESCGKNGGRPRFGKMNRDYDDGTMVLIQNHRPSVFACFVARLRIMDLHQSEVETRSKTCV